MKRKESQKSRITKTSRRDCFKNIGEVYLECGKFTKMRIEKY